MKRAVIVIFMLLGFVGTGLFAAFEKRCEGTPELIQEGEAKNWCPVCGMNLTMFYKTSHAVVLTDGTKRQYCSIRCLASEYDVIKDKIKQILVVDAKTEKLIDAKGAHYVIGSSVPGTMSRVSKIAFGSRADAEAFMKEYGGKEIVGFDAALKMAMEQMAEDNKMLMAKKEEMMYPKGKIILEKFCKVDIHPENYKTIALMKADIAGKKMCGELNEQQLQALSLYLWEKKREHKHEQGGPSAIEVPQDAKCPVCGMFVAKYPRWAAKVIVNTTPLYFDGAKDMFKFVLEPGKFAKSPAGITINEIVVTDYYTQKAIDGRKAFYVIGSDVYGPMGNELIPFATMDEAKTFMNDHKGKKIVTFDEVTVDLVYAQDK